MRKQQENVCDYRRLRARFLRYFCTAVNIDSSLALLQVSRASSLPPVEFNTNFTSSMWTSILFGTDMRISGLMQRRARPRVFNTLFFVRSTNLLKFIFKQKLFYIVISVYGTLSRLILVAGNHLPTNTTTGRPCRSTPLWYKQPIPDTSVKSSVFALLSNLSYLKVQPKTKILMVFLKIFGFSAIELIWWSFIICDSLKSMSNFELSSRSFFLIVLGFQPTRKKET